MKNYATGERHQFGKRGCCSRGHVYTPENVYLCKRKNAAGGIKIIRICKECRKAHFDRYRRDNLKKMSQKEVRLSGRRAQKCRQIILAAFDFKCGCCGEDTQEFLTLDHIGGGGSQHRKKQNNMYQAVVREGIPKDKYRILCMNCNWATRWGKPCPHELKRADRIRKIDLEFIEEFVES
jgi:hypothetical protein